jgi:acetyltransferase-like isoleucine patch superfamily enzyme
MTNGNSAAYRHSERSKASYLRSSEETAGRVEVSGRPGPSSATPRFYRYVAYSLLPRLERYRAVPRNALYGRLLGARDIKVGAGVRLRGADSIRIGKAFKALDHLWLEAVERDRSGNRYEPSLIIGDDVVFGFFVHVAATKRVEIGNHVLVGSRVIITDHNHGLYQGDLQSSPLEAPADRRLTPDRETIVEDNVWIGDGVVILPGSHIGRGSIIGANSVVNGTVPAHCIAAGLPARPIRFYDIESKRWIRRDHDTQTGP